MKKLLTALLFISGSAWGALFPTALTPIGVAASSVAIRNEQGTALAIVSSTTLSVTANPAGTYATSISSVGATPTAIDTNSGTKSAGTIRVILATDQPALTNKLLVTPDSVALPANQSVNVAQVAGTTTDTNSGVKSAGTVRMVIATDQPQLTNALKVDGSAVTQPVSIVASTMAIRSDGSFLTVANSTVASVGIFADNGVVAATNRQPTLPAIYQKAFLGGTAATKGNNAALSVSVVGNLFVSVMPDISTASYSASTNTYTLATTTMDVTAICGNATTMVMVTGLRLTCTQTTAGIVPLTVAKRSSAYGGVTISTMTAVADDSNYVAYKSSAVFFSAAGPQNGTLVGYVDQAQIGCMAAATASANDIYISPPEWRQKPIVLRGASECLGVNFQGASMSGAKISPTWKWWEVNTITP